jgi:diketogulonate reductase-like aldo/keto reductase
LEPLLATCSVKPHVNQFEFHPLGFDMDLVEYCNSKGIVVEAYSSLARGHDALHSDSRVIALAEGKSVTVGQVLLRWGLQKGVVILPKSKTPARIATNFQLDHFSLTDQEMTLLDSFNQDLHTCWNPNKVY